MKSFSLSAIAVLSTLSLIGCMGDDELDASADPSDPISVLGYDPSAERFDDIAVEPSKPGVGDINTQVAAFGYWGYTCSNANFCYYDHDTLTDRTCFLAGISGDLREGFVNMGRVNGRWRLEMRAAAGKTVGARTVCISGDTNLIGANWLGGQPAKQILGTVTSKRRCFLGGVFNTNSASNALDNATDYIRVWKDSASNWWLGGNISGAATPTVTAYCVDTAAAYNPYGIIGPTSFDMVENVNGDVCGLTKAGGAFINGSSDGTLIGYNGGTHMWSFSANSGKNGEALCIR